MKTTKSILFTGVALVTFFFASLVFHHQGQPEFKQPKLPDMTQFVKGIQPVMGAEGVWAGVRALATMARSINTTIESFMGGLASSGALSRSATYTFTVPTTSGTYNAKLVVGGSFAYTPSHGATAGGDGNYSNGFIMCKVGTTTKSLTLLFDSATSPGSGDGVVFLWNPGDFASTVFNSVMVESTLTGTGTSRTQITSWSGGPLAVTGGVTNKFRAIVSEANSGAQIEFLAASLLTGTTACGAGSYYALAFISNAASPNQSTARWGAKQTTYPVTDVCGSPTNPTNYGLFTSSGFVSDSVASGSIPSGYPSAASVDTLYGGLTGNAKITKAAVDGITIPTSPAALTCP